MNDLTWQAGLTIAILLGALILLASQRLRVDLVALLVLLALIGSGVLTPAAAFDEMGRPIIVTVAGIFVVGAALRETGVAALISKGILRWGSRRRSLLLLLLMGTAGLFSAFLSSMLVVVIFMPAVLQIGRKLEIPATQLLLPLGTAALLGNQLTLIGTPTNLIVDELLAQREVAAFGFFTLTPYAAVSLLLAMGWYWLMAQRTLPDKALDQTQRPSLDEIEQQFGLDGDFHEVQVQPQSDLVGKRLQESALRRQEQLAVVAIKAAGEEDLTPAHAAYVLQAGDRLIIKGEPAALRQSIARHDLANAETVALAQFSRTAQPELHLCEVVLPPHSAWVGQTLAELKLEQELGLRVLALNRQGKTLQEPIADHQLQTGDILLVQGAVAQVRGLKDLAVVTDLEPAAGEVITGKAKIALTVLGVVIVVVMLNWVSLAVALLVAAVALVLTGCLTLAQAYDSISGKFIVLLAGLLPLATALQQTGVAEGLAGLIVGVSPWLGAYGALFLLYLCTSLMTQVTPNAVTAAVMTPIALQLATALGQSPQTFAIAITFAAAASYVTPLVSTTNLLVKSKGRYGLGDYLRNTLPIYALQAGALFVMLIWLP